jgi:hypothetical protein
VVLGSKEFKQKYAHKVALSERYSQEVKVVLEALVHGDVGAISLRILVIVSMEGFLVGIFYDGGDLYG